MSAKESPLGFNTISLSRESPWMRDGSRVENLNITNGTTEEDTVETEDLVSPPTNYSYYHSFLSTPVKDEQQKSPFSYPGYQADLSQPGSRGRYLTRTKYLVTA